MPLAVSRACKRARRRLLATLRACERAQRRPLGVLAIARKCYRVPLAILANARKCSRVPLAILAIARKCPRRPLVLWRDRETSKQRPLATKAAPVGNSVRLQAGRTLPVDDLRDREKLPPGAGRPGFFVFIQRFSILLQRSTRRL